MNLKFFNKVNKYDFKSLFNKKKYTFFENGDFNINIIGIRFKVLNNIQDNSFNDALCLIYKEKGVEKRKVFEITTDPGLKSLKNFDNSKGCAILVPNQYKSTWQIGLHKGKYEALVQRKEVEVYRDKNKDNKLDYLNKDKGLFGINIHKAGLNSKIVEDWSAGCQVFRKSSNFEEFMNICRKSKELYGNSFTYTLLNEEDLI